MAQDDIARLAEAMRALKMAYEKYFAGVERLPPSAQHEQFKRELVRLTGANVRSTARRFQLQSMQAGLTSHEAHWQRLCRQIEEGTFKRDRLRAQAMLTAPPVGTPKMVTGGTGAARPSAGETPAYGPAMVQLHAAYEAARRQVGQTQAVPMAALAAAVEKQAASIRAQYRCENIDFQVAVRDGKVVVKALPRS